MDQILTGVLFGIISFLLLLCLPILLILVVILIMFAMVAFISIVGLVFLIIAYLWLYLTDFIYSIIVSFRKIFTKEI